MASTTTPRAQDIATRKIVALKEDFEVGNAVHIFNKHRISAAPIVNREGNVIGILSESDIIQCMGSCLFFDDQRGRSVGELMQTDVKVVASSTDIFELEKFFTDHHLHHAPVVDEDGHLVGMVSRRDILRALEEIMKEVAKHKIELKRPIELDRKTRIDTILKRP